VAGPLRETGTFSYSQAWSVPIADSFVEVETSCSLSPTGPSQGLVHVTDLESPTIAMLPIDNQGPVPHDDWMCIAAYTGSGTIVRNPSQFTWTDNGTGEPAEPFSMNLPLVGLYGGSSKRLVYLQNMADGKQTTQWRMHGNSVTQAMEYSILGYTEDINNGLSMTSQAVLRLGIGRGEWQELAAIYKDYLENMPNSWYAGPVGSSQNPMPSSMKNLTTEYSVHTERSDVYDAVVSSIWRTAQVVGDHMFVRAYDAYAPDFFNEFYFRGYLPGIPSFASGVKESRAIGDIVFAPYVNSTGAANWKLHSTYGSFVPTQLMVDMYSSFRRDKDGLIVGDLQPGGDEVMGLACLGYTPFSGDGTLGNKGRLGETIEEIVQHTHANGIYLDWFFAGTCFSAGHGHSVGSSIVPLTQRLDNVAFLRGLVDSQLEPGDNSGFCMEGSNWRATEYLDLVMSSPLALSAPVAAGEFGTTLFDNKVKNAYSIPMFRTVFDNVKIGRVSPPVGVGPDERCWLLANEVLSFGQLVLVGDHGASGGYRSSFPRSLPGYTFLTGSLARFIGGGFQEYHNGTLKTALSEFVVSVQDTTFSKNVTVSFGGIADDIVPAQNAKLLVHGLYEAPNGDYALAVCNPWVERDQSVMKAAFTFDPLDYQDFLGAAGTYSVSYVDTFSQEVSVSTAQVGTFSTVDHTVLPGEIVYWKFTPQ
jgi:hypothetical protein